MPASWTAATTSSAASSGIRLTSGFLLAEGTSAPPLERRRHRIRAHAEDLQPGVVLVVGRDEDPGSIRPVGAVQHFADRLLVLLPLPAVAPVVRTDLVVLEAVGLARLEPLELRLPIDVQEELGHLHAVRGERPLEGVDLVVGALPLGFPRQPLHPLHQHPAVPASVEDRDLAAGGQPVPEPPEVVVPAALLVRWSDGPHLVPARIQLGGEPLDAPALPCGVPALEDEDGPMAALEHLDLKSEHLPLAPLQLHLVVLVSLHPDRKVQLVERKSPGWVHL